jgi:type IV pilus assembly protein PilP
MKTYPATGFCTATAWMASAAFLLLTGCAETERDGGLQSWMDNERNRHKTLAPTLSDDPDHLIVEVTLQDSTQRKGVEPFSSLRLLRIGANDGAAIAKTPVPKEKSSRPTLPLNASPLADMRLVGSLQRGGQPLALLRVNGLIYPVRVGDRLGQDQGRVTGITLTGLVLRESALDSAGQPVERLVSLALVSEP